MSENNIHHWTTKDLHAPVDWVQRSLDETDGIAIPAPDSAILHALIGLFLQQAETNALLKKIGQTLLELRPDSLPRDEGGLDVPPHL